MDKIVSLARRRGFIYPSSEIYGGFSGFWDYGPLGVEIKNHIKNNWWNYFVTQRDDIFGLDSSVILNPRVWEASRHTGSGFADILRECKNCHHRFRKDDIKDNNKCLDCGGPLTEEKKFNILVKTFIGPVEDMGALAYLRGETAQGIFINFKNIIDNFHPKIPFGIAQIGKAFRNEITPGNFIFRSREFEMMEIEYFVNPNEAQRYFTYWTEEALKWFLSLGLQRKNLRFYDHPKEKLAHYSKATRDIEYNFPFGWSELQGTANRTDFDLKQHSKFLNKDLRYQINKEEKFYPYVIEPSFGVERLFLAILLDVYFEDPKNNRVVLRLPPKLAPYKIAVFPLLANKPALVNKAKDIYSSLKKTFKVVFDDRGNIGKRYYSQDEIGTPWCITVDFQTLEDDTVTVRDRDTTKQERISSLKLDAYFKNKLSY